MDACEDAPVAPLFLAGLCEVVSLETPAPSASSACGSAFEPLHPAAARPPRSGQTSMPWSGPAISIQPRTVSRTSPVNLAPFGSRPRNRCHRCMQNDRGSPGRRSELAEPIVSHSGESRRHANHRQQGVMKFIGVTRLRPYLRRYLCNRRRIQNSRSAGDVRMQSSSQLHGACPALFERSIVQIRVRIGVRGYNRDSRTTRARRSPWRRSESHPAPFCRGRAPVHRYPWLRAGNYRSSL